MFVPSEDIDLVADAHRRCLVVVEGLSDDDVRRDSMLPGWSVGHVLTHLARNADSHVRRTRAAATGRFVEQYEGGVEGRRKEIEDGSSRPATELIEDVRESCSRVEDAWRALPEGAWLARSRDSGGQERFLFELPGRRRQEVEVHLVDMGCGTTHREWPDDFVRSWLPRAREAAWSRLAPQARSPGFENPADELAWLYGRHRVDGLPDPPPFG